MFEFLKRLPRSEIVGAVLSPNDPGISRGEMLRRKYSAEIASANAVALCPPASNARIAECENSVAPIRMPAELREFLAVCDGECTFGAVLPNIQFFGVSAIIESRTMLRKMMEEEMLPDDLEHDLPFGRDMRTRLLVVNCTGDVGAGVVRLIDMDELSATIVSRSLVNFYKRVAEMVDFNLRGRAKCAGDFRRLSSVELGIMKSIEGEYAALLTSDAATASFGQHFDTM